MAVVIEPVNWDVNSWGLKTHVGVYAYEFILHQTFYQDWELIWYQNETYNSYILCSYDTEDEARQDLERLAELWQI